MAGLAEDDEGLRGARFWLVRAVWTVAGIAGVVGVATSVQDLISAPARPARQLAKISLVPDAPPPPPPPPKEERRQEPPKEQEKQVHVEQPKPQEAPPQPSEQLKMEGPGSDTGIAGVQAGAVTQEYRGQTIGGTGSGGGTGYAWYGGALQQEVQAYLQKNAKLRGAEYRVTVRIWLSSNGELSRIELGGTTGNPETDEHLKAALAEMPALKQPPPAEMPQPIKLRVTSRA